MIRERLTNQRDFTKETIPLVLKQKKFVNLRVANTTFKLYTQSHFCFVYNKKQQNLQIASSSYLSNGKLDFLVKSRVFITRFQQHLYKVYVIAYLKLIRHSNKIEIFSVSLCVFFLFFFLDFCFVQFLCIFCSFFLCPFGRLIN